MEHNKLQQHAEELVEMYCEHYNLQPIKIKVKFLKGCGRAQYSTRSISIPVWTFEQGGLEYFTAYILHEIVHIILYDTVSGNQGHNATFKALEIKILKEWNLVSKEYKKAYYKRLETVTGNLLWIHGTMTQREAAGMKPYSLLKVRQ